jgi:AcrR family transcriptional regulator
MISRAPAVASRPDGRATRWAGHREQRRRAMVEVAIQVIERDGPSASVDQVAAEIGVGRQVLYRQFDDRADLDRAIADRVVALVVEHVLPQVDTSPDVDTAIRDALNAYLDHIEAHPHLYRFIRAYDTARDGGDDPMGQVKELLATRIAAYAGHGVVDQPTRLLAAGAVGLCDGVIRDWLRDRSVSPREVVLQQLGRMLKGVGGAARPPRSAPEPRSSPEAGS